MNILIGSWYIEYGSNIFDEIDITDDYQIKISKSTYENPHDWNHVGYISEENNEFFMRSKNNPNKYNKIKIINNNNLHIEHYNPNLYFSNAIAYRINSMFDINLPNSNSKIAFITAIYGPYEASCKTPSKQSINADFICFTNVENIKANGWIIDNVPYHIENKSHLDNDEYINSLSNNKHTFNIAKYYKQQFYNIPRLQKYDIVVWLDGTVQITNPLTAEWITNKIQSQNEIIAVEHEYRHGKLLSEVNASHDSRYMSTFWFNQSQPYQDVDKQYRAYIEDEYNDNDYWRSINPNKIHLGVWVTCFVAFNINSQKVKDFLDMWYLQTLKYTTQDQIGFPYVVQKMNMIPYTIPDDEITGKGHSSTTFYTKHCHGQ